MEPTITQKIDKWAHEHPYQAGLVKGTAFTLSAVAGAYLGFRIQGFRMVRPIASEDGVVRVIDIFGKVYKAGETYKK